MSRALSLKRITYVGIKLSRPTFVYFVITAPTIYVSAGIKTRTYRHMSIKYYTNVCNLESTRTVGKNSLYKTLKFIFTFQYIRSLHLI